MLAARGDEFQPVLESKCAGKLQRRVFAKAQAGIRGHFFRIDQARALGGGETSDAGDINCWLANVCLIEPILRAVEADFAKVKADELIGAIEDFPRGRRGLVKVFAHAHRLSALSRTEDVSLSAHSWHGRPDRKST